MPIRANYDRLAGPIVQPRQAHRTPDARGAAQGASISACAVVTSRNRSRCVLQQSPQTPSRSLVRYSIPQPLPVETCVQPTRYRPAAVGLYPEPSAAQQSFQWRTRQQIIEIQSHPGVTPYSDSAMIRFLHARQSVQRLWLHSSPTPALNARSAGPHRQNRSEPAPHAICSPHQASAVWAWPRSAS